MHGKPGKGNFGGDATGGEPVGVRDAALPDGRAEVYLLRLNQPQAGIHALGVVEGAPAVADLLKGGFQADGGSVGAVGTHGLDHVGHGEDLRLEEDVLVGETLGIA